MEHIKVDSVQISLYEEFNVHSLGHIITDKNHLIRVLKMLFDDENEVIVFRQNNDSSYTVYYRQQNMDETIVLDNAIRIRFEGTYDEYESVQGRVAQILKNRGLIRKSNDYCKIIQLDSKEKFLVMDIYVAV